MHPIQKVFFLCGADGGEGNKIEEDGGAGVKLKPNELNCGYFYSVRCFG